MTWVVYESLLHVRGRRLVVVCSRAEWDELPKDVRANYTLVQTGITNEGEAERLARHLAGVPEGRKRVA
jgi:hypothetical protein